MKHDFDLIIIGSGAGGSVGAHYAASLGKKVAVFEKTVIGGECPNWACIPTKALLYAADVYQAVKKASQFGTIVHSIALNYKTVKNWKDLVVSRTGAAKGAASFAEDGIILVKAKATFTSPRSVTAVGKTYTADKFIIATGSSVFVPPVPGLAEAGYITFRQAVDFDSQPKSIFILGGGPIGCEFTQIFNTFGSKVYLADNVPRLLAKDEPEVGQLIEALFTNRGVNVLTSCTVNKVVPHGKQKIVQYEHQGKHHEIVVDEILVATGKRPVLDLDLEKAGVAFDNHGIKVNPYLQTSKPHIYATGDVVGPYLFTHTGYYQSYIAAHNAFSQNPIKPDYSVVPRCVFTSPEVASVGITEEQAKEKKIRTLRGVAPIAVLGRANTSNELDGFVKVITDQSGKILGAAIVAPRAGELIHQLAMAMQLKAKASDVANMIHAFPTFSEAIKIACSSLNS